MPVDWDLTWLSPPPYPVPHPQPPLQGTTVALAALASQPAAMSGRLAAAALLAPVAYVSRMRSPVFRAMSWGRADLVGVSVRVWLWLCVIGGLHS